MVGDKQNIMQYLLNVGGNPFMLQAFSQGAGNIAMLVTVGRISVVVYLGDVAHGVNSCIGRGLLYSGNSRALLVETGQRSTSFSK
jgi:hypothetical protein